MSSAWRIARPRRTGLRARVATNLVAQLGARALAATVGLVTISTVSRYLDTPTFGAYLTLLSMQAVLTSVAEFGLTPTSLRGLARAGAAPEQLAQVVGSAAVLRATAACVAMLGGLILVALTPALRANVGAAFALFVSVPMVALLSSLYGSLLQARLRVDLQNLGVAAGTVAWLCGVLIASNTSAGLVGLMLAFTVSAAIGGLVTYGFYAASGGHRGARVSRTLILAILREAAPLGVAAIVSSLYVRADLFLLLVLADESAVALYGSAFKLIEQALVVAVLLSASLLPILVNSAGSSSFAAVARRGTAGFLAAGVALAGILVVFGGAIIDVLFPPPISVSRALVPALACVVPLMFVNSALNATLIAQGRTREVLAMNLGALALLFTLGAAMIGLFDLYGAVLSLAVREAFVTCVNVWLGRHWIFRVRM